MGGRLRCLGSRAVPIPPGFTALLLLLWLLPQMSGILRPAESSAVPALRKIAERWTLETLRNSSPSERRSAITAAVPPQAGALRAVRESILVVAHPGLVQGFTLPADTFSEPLDKLRISVTLWNGSALTRDHWLSFWPTDHQIVVHARRSDVGMHDFLLRAVPRSHEGYGSEAVAVAPACLRVIVEELLDQSSRVASTVQTKACHPPSAAANQPPRTTVSSLVVKAERGKELRYELPDNLFSDPQDGVRRHLELQLFSVTDRESRSPTVSRVSSSSALQLVSAPATSRYLSGLYWEPVSRSTGLQYLLRATDGEGAYTDVSVQLSITEPPAPAFVFRAQLSVDWSSFSNDVMRQLDFMSRVAHVAGDSGTVNVSLLDVRQSIQSSTPLSKLHRLQRRSQVDLRQASSVLVTWTHTGLAPAAVASACPAEAIRSLARRFMVHDAITVAAADKDSGLGLFGVISIELEPRERCLNKVANEVAMPPVVTQLVVDAAVSVIALILSIAVIAVLIIRCRNRGKSANVSGSPNGSFISKTVPVMCDGLEDGDKRAPLEYAMPTIMQNEEKTLMSLSPPDDAHQFGSGSGFGKAYPEQKQPLMSQQHRADRCLAWLKMRRHTALPTAASAADQRAGRKQHFRKAGVARLSLLAGSRKPSAGRARTARRAE